MLFQCISASAVIASKKVQLSQIWSRTRAFQRAIDKVHMLPLTFPKSGSKSWFVVKNRFPYISVLHEASDFKFGKELGFVKARHKITRRRKGWPCRALGELPNIWGFYFNIYTTAEASGFKFGTQLGFAKARHKITFRAKSGVALG